MSKLFIASDHAGFALKGALVEHIQTLGYDIEDIGAFSFNPEDDYPDFVTPLAKRVASESGSRGIIIGGSGQGEAMCANRISGVRAAVFYMSTASENKYEIAQLSRQHNDANVLSLGARFFSENEAIEAVRIFLETEFPGDERHQRRLAKF